MRSGCASSHEAMLLIERFALVAELEGLTKAYWFLEKAGLSADLANKWFQQPAVIMIT